MGAEPRWKKAGKNRGCGRFDPPVYYIAAIENWNWGYSLSLNAERDPIDPFHEFRHLEIRGRLLHPKGLRTDRIALTFLPSRDLDQGRREALRPLLVGSLNRYGTTITGLLSLPQDALPPILQMLLGEQFKFVVAHGTGFSRRRATLSGFRLAMKLEPDDLPEGVELPG